MSFPYSHLLNKSEALQKLSSFDESIDSRKKRFIGYPCNADLHLEKFINWWSKSAMSELPLNDVGDPFSETSYTLNSHPFEREVVDYFSSIYNVHPSWGYVTSGGTEGNEQGLYMGRRVLSQFGKPILYFSEESHYSVSSLGKILNLEYCKIDAEESGKMSEEALKETIDPSRPALFSLSIGTTFKGGIDSIENIDKIVKEKGIKHVYYHADAALFGGYLPYLTDPLAPTLDFEKHPYDSIAVSGHKFFGSPFPFGIFLIKNKYLSSFHTDFIQYIDAENITIPCSRSSLNTLLFWWIVHTTPIENFQEQAKTMIQNANYLYYSLREKNYPVWLNSFSNTVYFKQPSLEVCSKWTLAKTNCHKLGLLAHAVVMQHVDRNMIDDFVADVIDFLQ
ncbi:MAG: histidine decarboxylase [Parachlamydiaceae bacterium]|nr:histidine decarboxylase [Parachlamydiaceae bacterium]